MEEAAQERERQREAAERDRSKVGLFYLYTRSLLTLSHTRISRQREAAEHDRSKVQGLGLGIRFRFQA